MVLFRLQFGNALEIVHFLTDTYIMPANWQRARAVLSTQFAAMNPSGTNNTGTSAAKAVPNIET
jgi:hypothetical protein